VVKGPTAPMPSRRRSAAAAPVMLQHAATLGPPIMASLWSESSPEAWQAALDGYSEAVAAKGKEGLPELDR